MRKILYVIFILIFVILVLYKGNAIRDKEQQEIISISQEWNKNGKPVDIIIAKKDVTYCYEKVSGVVKGRRTIIVEIPPEKIQSLKPRQEFSSVKYINIKGKVESISKHMDIVTGLFTLSLGSEEDINLPESSIIPLRVKIKTFYNYIKIPTVSVIINAGSTYCWVIENNRAVKREVKQGLECDGSIQILEGLSEGDRVCTNGTSNLNENDKIMIRKQVQQ